MILEDTPSGNLRLLDPERPETAVRVTRAEVRNAAAVFALLDRWDREAVGDDAIDNEATG
jgi:hypothetical protein